MSIMRSRLPPFARGEPQRLRDRSSWDSIIDGERPFAEDPLFERTGHRSCRRIAFFGYDDHHVPTGHLLPPHQFRPLSVLSFNNNTDSLPREDETTITMLGGGHVRRRSIGYNPSPCVRVEKWKHAAFQDDEKVPNKARQPSIASTSSSKFGEERMTRARQGLLERQSLEESSLVAEGEDLASFFLQRYSPALLQASTPVLAHRQSRPQARGGYRRVAHQPHALQHDPRMRARGRGHGHRRRYLPAAIRAFPSSVFETIQEERPSPASSIGGYKSSPTARHGTFVVDAGLMDLSAGGAEWQDVLQSGGLDRHRFSSYALQAFSPPKHPDGMQALLQHSVQNYGPLPIEYGPRRVRSRTQSCSSPYPQRQAVPSASPELLSRPSPSEPDNALQAVDVNSNPTVEVHMSPAVLSPKRGNA
ncbi:hypothetical protein R3P38DRAFT_3291971 [Favolaschia claudopus]|uniref:Uncharacterized protein n=1 Tax=Favolaschia claudopus TaxID=2862362 RepID=A0AAV9ZLQ6_9AGAR